MDSSAVIVVDCWNKHWDRSSQKSLDEGCPKINEFLCKMRKNGSLIIHCISDVVGKVKYVKEEYQYIKKNKMDIMKDLQKLNFPMVLDAPGSKIWTKVHDSIKIEKTDFNTTDVNQIYNILKQNNIKNLYYVGYHANICLLWTRPFSIMQMKNNFEGKIYLVENLTDWFGRFKKEVIQFYNKFVCQTINSKEVYGKNIIHN